MVEAYPLHWPEGWQRTTTSRTYLPGNQPFGMSRNRLIRELRLLGAKNYVLSTNVPVRRDGLPYADFRRPSDPGVAVYFEYRKSQMCLACDRYAWIEDNVRAIALTLDALRGIERWGASDMLECAFRGFTALPENSTRTWREVFGFSRTDSIGLDDVDDRFRKLALERHPDQGGSEGEMCELLQARDDARTELGA
jgi:hypothetical protein